MRPPSRNHGTAARAGRGRASGARSLSPESDRPSQLPRSWPPSLDSVRDAVLNALGDAGHRMLVSMLETGEWSIEGNELVIKVAVIG